MRNIQPYCVSYNNITDGPSRMSGLEIAQSFANGFFLPFLRIRSVENILYFRLFSKYLSGLISLVLRGFDCSRVVHRETCRRRSTRCLVGLGVGGVRRAVGSPKSNLSGDLPRLEALSSISSFPMLHILGFVSSGRCSCSPSRWIR